MWSAQLSALIIQKYGGTSVADVEKIQSVAKHIRATKAKGCSLVVVISAMGHQTDQLLNLAHSVSAHPNPREVDMLLTAGERISMSLLSMALLDLGVPCRSLTGSQSGIITDEVHGHARIEKILGDRIRQGLNQGEVVIVAGFQGVCARTKEITTLGRGGSDLTAIALSKALDASLCEIYKDVDGVYSADPKFVSGAVKVGRLSWRQMSDLCWSGSEVLHARCLHVAETFQIPILIRSSFEFEKAGTVISGEEVMEKFVLKALTHKSDMAWMRFQVSGNLSSQLVAHISKFLWSRGESALSTNFEFKANDEGSELRILVSESQLSALEEYIENLRTSSLPYEISSWESCSGLCSITLVGSGFLQSPEISELVVKTLGDIVCRGMELRSHALSILVAKADFIGALARLHTLITESGSD